MKKLISVLTVAVFAFSIAIAQQETGKTKPACCANKEACAHHKEGGKQCSKAEKKECSKKCEKGCKKACCANKGASSSADSTSSAKPGCSGHGHGH